MPSHQQSSIDERVQTLDVHIVDVLAHLEALLRHSHSIQRALLKLRTEAAPPLPAPSKDVLAALQHSAQQMQVDWHMLGSIIDDLIIGIDALPLHKA